MCLICVRTGKIVEKNEKHKTRRDNCKDYQR